MPIIYYKNLKIHRLDFLLGHLAAFVKEDVLVLMTLFVSNLVWLNRRNLFCKFQARGNFG
jgi:hypothetical protein